MIDPEGHLAAIHTVFAGAKNAAVNWDDTAKALLDWDTWVSDPARAMGHLAPDLVIALFTAGAGTVAARGTRAAHLDELAALNRADDLDELADAARLVVEAGPLPELWDLHHKYGRGTDEWADAVVARYPRLIKDDVLALFEYTDGDYGTVNHYLRDPDSFPAEFHAAKVAHLEQMSEALAKLPRYEGGTLFRGCEPPRRGPGGLATGRAHLGPGVPQHDHQPDDGQPLRVGAQHLHPDRGQHLGRGHPAVVQPLERAGGPLRPEHRVRGRLP